MKKTQMIVRGAKYSYKNEEEIENLLAWNLYDYLILAFPLFLFILVSSLVLFCAWH
jgi:hypothetical protein